MRCPQCQQENPPQAKFCLEALQVPATVQTILAAPIMRRCDALGTTLTISASEMMVWKKP